jgi:hypothetical protein
VRKPLIVALVAGAVSLSGSAIALASPSPNGPGQPGSIPPAGTTCGNPSHNADNTPGMNSPSGGSASAQSPFNSAGQAGTVYAGNPGTASAMHSNSPKAVSQYDIACYQQTSNPGHS